MVRQATAAANPKEVKRAGHEQYRKGCFKEALRLYDCLSGALPWASTADRASSSSSTG
jgi:hypothetical protein